MRISDWSSDVCSSNLSTPEGAMSYAMGVDVSKSTLEVCAEPSATTRTFANDQVGIDVLIAWLLPMKPSRVVFEASGGYEKTQMIVMIGAGLTASRVNARPLRDFAQALGDRKSEGWSKG